MRSGTELSQFLRIFPFYSLTLWFVYLFVLAYFDASFANTK